MTMYTAAITLVVNVWVAWGWYLFGRSRGRRQGKIEGRDLGMREGIEFGAKAVATRIVPLLVDRGIPWEDIQAAMGWVSQLRPPAKDAHN